MNTGYALLSDQGPLHPFTAFDKNGSVRRIPNVFVDSVYANPALIAANNSLEEAARLFRLPPPPVREDLPPAPLCSIANAMLEKRSTSSRRALVSAAGAYCRWEARTALRAAAEIYARHTLAVGPLKKHCKRLPGFANWLAIETARLDRHRYPEILQLAQRRTEMALEAPSL